MRTMKIVLVHNSYQQGGGEDVVFAQERRNLERAGHDVLVYHRSNSEIENLGARPFDRIALAKNTIWSSNTRREFEALLAREAPDLVHVHNTFFMISPSIYTACRDRGVPVVQTLHNFRLLCPAGTLYRDGAVCEACLTSGVWSSVRYSCYRESRAATATVALMLATHTLLGTWRHSIDTYIALTNFSRDKFISAGLDPDKIAVKPNFVDPDPGERTNVGDYALYIGRLSEEKGASVLVEAWRRLPVRCPLHVVGEGPLRATLESKAQEYAASRINFRGRLSREETIALVKGARFVVVPSTCYEGFPMAIAEAMACGTPLICSRLGAMKEIVADHATGLHFTPGDPDDLAREVDWALKQPADMEEMGRAARREYEAHYTAERNYSILMEIYERTLTRSSDCVPALSN